jgi:hypothetical protein
MLYAFSIVEPLEERRLLSAAIINAGAAEASDVTGTFSGVLKLRKPDEAGRRSFVLTLDVTSEDAAGRIDGTLSGDVFGNTTFAGGKVGAAGKGGVPLSLSFSGDRSGSLDAKLSASSADRLIGTVHDVNGAKLGTFRLNRFDNISMTSAPSTGTSTSGAGTGAAGSTSQQTTSGANAVTTVFRRRQTVTFVHAAGTGGGTPNIATIDTTTTNTTSNSGAQNTSGNGNGSVLLGPGTMNQIPPDGSVNVTSGSPDVSTSGGGGVGSGIDISTANGGPTGVNAPDGSVSTTSSSGSPDISTAAGGGMGSGIDISTANGSLNGPSINAPTTVVDTSSSGAAGSTTTSTTVVSSSSGNAVTNTTGGTMTTTASTFPTMITSAG